jgi:acetoin utilization deacetylase AcuC-like enzyme
MKNMVKTGIVYHPDYLLHDTGFSHPEKKERLEAIMRHLENCGLLKELSPIEPTPADIETLCLIHDEKYILSIKEMIESGQVILDAGDTIASKGTWTAALLAAGGACSAVDAVMKGKVSRVFCAIRPPGHHARRDKAMGFCIFNNVAIAARHLQKEHGIRRIAIIDWDVHHGNGTQESFYSDSTVFYLSMHQSPHYPGTGFADEIGEGNGKDFIYNIPVFPHTSNEEYLLLFEDAIESEMLRFRPEFVLISAGFDAHADDPLGNLLLTHESFREMTETVCHAADTYASGKVVSVLEGGYDLDALPRSVEAHIRALMK